MYLEKHTDYGFSADGLGCDFEEEQHLLLKEHTYKFKDINELDRKYTLGKCEVKEIDTLFMDYNEISECADADSDAFIQALKEYESKYHNAEHCFKVVFISKLELQKQYRNNGYGTELLNIVMGDMYSPRTLYLLEPCPISHSKDDNKRNRYIKENMKQLKKFYRQFGYKSITPKSQYMWCVRGSR